MADWRTDLCSRIRAPASANNLKALDLWARSEAVPVNYHNPLGSRFFVESEHRFSDLTEWRQFSSIGAAVNAYARLLADVAFADIAGLMRSRADPFQLWQIIHLSKWRPLDFQSGKYPVLLYRQAVEPVVTGVPPVEPVSELAHDLFHAWRNLTTELHHHTARQLARSRHWGRRLHSAVR